MNRVLSSDSQSDSGTGPHRADLDELRAALQSGNTALGIEFGSTRIKACLVDARNPGRVLAVGSHEWENEFVDQMWTYSLDAVWQGARGAYAELAAQVQHEYGVPLRAIGSIGISAMMHGYLAFDTNDELLTPFRTWRNTNTGRAAQELSHEFGVNIPLRWSIAHLHQAVLDREEHLHHLAFLTTLAGYVHWKLTGERVLGIGDASGMFPIDTVAGDYDSQLLERYDTLAAGCLPTPHVRDLLPRVVVAGEQAGYLTAEGAALLDPEGVLQPGSVVCPPEGDAGTGMVATRSVAPRTGNVSAGTSIFAMVVLEQPLTGVHDELDLVTTPAGDLVAMVHCNNGASELAEWVDLFTEYAHAAGVPLESDDSYEVLFRSALAATPDAGGVLAYNHLSGEPLAGLSEGRPLIVRTPGSQLRLGTFMRAQLYGVFATLALGMTVLRDENVAVDTMFAHGGMFRTAGVAQRFLAGALDTPVSLAQTASEGGAWGAAVLAAYTLQRSSKRVEADTSVSLSEYLDQDVFRDFTFVTVAPDPSDVEGFSHYLVRYKAGLAIERAAVAALLPEGESE